MSTPSQSSPSSEASDSSKEQTPDVLFRDLGLSDAVMQAVNSVGYETPSQIQAATIPPLLAGRDVLGQAQTGTGKTAAFALPILTRIKPGSKAPKALVLAPTRELAIQVAEAFQRYASHIKGFHVLPIYGGQSYEPQLSALRRGVDVVVGTPGRVMDHIKRGTLKLHDLEWMVLDEADEMLRMGFIDDVEWVFENTPPGRQVALFSATMPSAIRRIAKTHLKNPEEVTIKSSTSTVLAIRQRYWIVGGCSKLEALTRMLEAETFDGVLIFARTKRSTDELAEKLSARGYSCAALNGDIQQSQRERTVNRLKNGQLDVIVATDVAARGLDVERISHVINFDIPHDTESYVHRIGRTGRAGRTGDAILFVTQRERRLLKAIEHATRQKIEPMALPSVAEVNEQRVTRFKQRITDTIEAGHLGAFKALIGEYREANEVETDSLLAALASLAQGDEPLMLKPGKADKAGGPASFDNNNSSERSSRTPSKGKPPRGDDKDLETFRIAVGKEHGVEARNIVGAIANEAGVDTRNIGRIAIRGDHSFVDLPRGMGADVFEHLKSVQVMDRSLDIRREDNPSPGSGPKRKLKLKAGDGKKTSKKPKKNKKAKKRERALKSQ